MSADEPSAHLPDMTIAAKPQPKPKAAAPEATLTAADRCSRCDAQAYAKSQHGDLSLLWCAHHLREHKDKLGAALVLDETWRLDKANAAFKGGQ